MKKEKAGVHYFANFPSYGIVGTDEYQPRRFLYLIIESAVEVHSPTFIGISSITETQTFIRKAILQFRIGW